MNVGDIVQLKSGGPKLTVSRVVDADIVECVWFSSGFEAAAELHTASLLVVCLDIIHTVP